MLLIIVGAGASYDSDWRRSIKTESETHVVERPQYGYGFRPPLAKDLFDEDRFGKYVAAYPPSQGLMDQLRRAAPAVEEELERIRDTARTQEHLPRQLLGVRYYLRELIAQTVDQWNKAKPDEITNFTRLVSRLEPWRQEQSRKLNHYERVAIVTFNYDTLFDDALRHALPKFPLIAIDDYTSDHRYALFKLHGSVDWWREVEGTWVANAGSISPTTSWAATMFDPPDSYTETGAFRVGGTGHPCVPCLALPTATKGVADFACPDAHIDELRKLLPEVTDVLIIGWKGIEGHFLELWRLIHATKRDPSIRTLSIVDVSINEGQEIAARITHEVGLTLKRDLYYETFSTFVNEKLDEYLSFLQ
jgi:hypothetical protein